MPPATVVDDVWKQYLIGRARYSSLRDIISGGFRRLLGRPQSETERTREFFALKGVSFEVEQGSTLGIIGPNGAGKSTMLKILSRVTRPTRGTVEMNGRVSALIEVGAGFHPELTGRENIYLNGSILGMTRREIDGKLGPIVDFAGLEQFIDTPVKYYSSGMFARLGFSVAAHVEPDILLVDEVLSVGDWGFQQKCFERMKQIVQGGATVVFVSHNMPAVSMLCERAILLGEGEVLADGSVEEAISGYHRRVTISGQDGRTDHRGTQLPTEVLAVRLLDESGGERHLFRSGERFELWLEIRARRAYSSPVLHVMIRSSKGVGLFGTDSDRAGVRLGPLVAGQSIRASVGGRLNLLGGTYAVACGIRDRDGQEPLVVSESVTAFDIEPNSEADGLAHLESSMRVAADPASPGKEP